MPQYRQPELAEAAAMPCYRIIVSASSRALIRVRSLLTIRIH